MPSPSLFDVPLHELLLPLSATSLKAEPTDTGLVVQHEHFVMKIDVVAGLPGGHGKYPIQAAVCLRSDLPSGLAGFLQTPRQAFLPNQFAAAGAITTDGERRFVGARLTIHEGDLPSLWDFYALILISAITLGPDAILGGMRRSVLRQQPNESPSAWDSKDLQAVVDTLRERAGILGFAGEDGLTCEFPLQEGALSAVMGHNTALWGMRITSHPEIGGGLGYRLQLWNPPNLDEASLDTITDNLNRKEMEPRSLPPHLGGWSRSPGDSTISYWGFIPNALSSLPSIALNTTTWGVARARWAAAILAVYDDTKRKPLVERPKITTIRCWQCKEPLTITPETRGKEGEVPKVRNEAGTSEVTVLLAVAFGERSLFRRGVDSRYGQTFYVGKGLPRTLNRTE